MNTLYIDTSALAKWYVRESNSDEFETFINRYVGAFISHLTLVEFRCLLARRYRNGEITPEIVKTVYQTFEEDIQQGYLHVLSVADQHFFKARDLIESLPTLSLRTLDALHLAIAIENKVDLLATADKVMVEAATNLGIRTQIF